MANATRQQIEIHIQNREAYTAASSHAEVRPSYVTQGRLNNEEYTDLHNAADEGTLSYLVYSYATPIAWVVNGQPHVTEQRFSPTTSQHQYTCRYGLGL